METTSNVFQKNYIANIQYVFNQFWVYLFLFFFLPCPKEYWPTPPLLLSFFPSFWSEAKEI
jgi:hypothetical protein